MNLQQIFDYELAEKRREVIQRFGNLPFTVEVGGREIRLPNLYSVIKSIDQTNPYMMTDEEHETAKVLEAGFTAYLAVNDRVTEFLNLAPQEPEPKRGEFANLYSMYVASNIVSQRLEDVVAKLDPVKVRGVNEQYRFAEIFSDSRDDTMKEMLKLYLSALVKKQNGQNYIRDGQDLANITKQIFDTLAEQCVKRKEFYGPALNEALEGLNLQIGDTVVSGFSFVPKKQQRRDYGITFDDIVGNEELIQTLKAIGRNMLFYDPQEGKNPAFEVFDFSKTYLLYGTPGTGKTITLKAFLNWMQDEAEKHGKPFKHINITNAIKSKWFGESVQNLKALLGEATGGEYVAVVTIEDLDAIFAAREELKDRPEEKALINELMNTLEGVMADNKGNAVFIATTNKPASLDDALAERFRENQVEVKGPITPEDYVRLFQILLRKAIKNEYVQLPGDDPRWLDLGKLCSGYREVYSFSGRAVKNITRDTMTRASRFDLSQEFANKTDDEISKTLGPLYAAEPEEVQAKLREFAVKVDYEELVGAVERYREEGVKQEELRQAERKRRIIEAITDGVAHQRLINRLADEKNLGNKSLDTIKRDLEQTEV